MFISHRFFWKAYYIIIIIYFLRTQIFYSTFMFLLVYNFRCIATHRVSTVEFKLKKPYLNVPKTFLTF